MKMEKKILKDICRGKGIKSLRTNTVELTGIKPRYHSLETLGRMCTPCDLIDKSTYFGTHA